LPGTGIDPLRSSLQGFFDQRTADATIGPGDQNCLVSDLHCFSYSFSRRIAESL
jgi:hypothetical protein